MPDTNNTFKIGLCMAGAISAGAYTAGAMDYLIEALEEWQKRKDSNVPNTPSHQVEIPIIGGASAGGMTGIVAASALQEEIDPVRQLDNNIMAPNPNNKFYHSWVDLISDDMLSVLLDTSDMSKHEVPSALNSDFIDLIAERAVKVSNESTINRKYISKNLKLFVTLSNLEGMNFSVTFRSNSPNLNRYIVGSHNDYVCFKLSKTEGEYKNDGWIPLNFMTELNTDIAKNAAMATGAFPVGLKARKVRRNIRYMNDLDWFHHITKDANKKFEVDPYDTVNVDGGMINNEPFDKMRDLLMKETEQNMEEFQDYDRFKSTVLMIDPFPTEPGVFNSSTEMMTIVGNTLSALIGQARIKSSVLIDALDSKKAGQFLIAPVRYEKSGGEEVEIEGKKAIACGTLDGFGGFINKEFRIHDYFLGRANCEKFLRDHFTVPANTTNEIFVNGYSSIAKKDQFISKTDGGLQIIPIFTERHSEPYMPQFSNNRTWPSISIDEIYSYRKKIKKRVEKILFNITKYSTTQRALIWIGAKVVINGKITDAVIDTMAKSLEDHKLLK